MGFGYAKGPHLPPLYLDTKSNILKTEAQKGDELMTSVTRQVMERPGIGTQEIISNDRCELRILRDPYLNKIFAKINPVQESDIFLFPSVTLTESDPLYNLSNVVVLDDEQSMRLSDNLKMISEFLKEPEVLKIQKEISDLAKLKKKT